MRAVLVGLMLALMIIPTVGAEIVYNNRCYSDTLAREADFTIDGYTYVLNNTVDCEYGCDSVLKQCRGPPISGWIIAGGFVGFLMLIGAAIWKFGG